MVIHGYHGLKLPWEGHKKALNRIVIGNSTIVLPSALAHNKGITKEVQMDGIRSHANEMWWLLMLRAIALLLFGVVATVWPGLTLLVLATAFAVYLLVAGVVDIIGGIRGIGNRSMWFLTMLLGLAEIGVAIYLFKHNLVLGTFIAVLGLSLVVFGILEVISAFEPGEDGGRRFLLIIGGLLSFIAGVITLRYPASSGLTFVWILGVWGLIAGCVQVAMCLSLRSQMHKLEKTA
jgi:uncharacterized membrane protein HdeD (DUF308 family)